MCSREEDIPRFVEKIYAGIANKKLTAFSAFTCEFGKNAEEGSTRRIQSTKSRAKARRETVASREAAEAEEMLAEMHSKYKKETAEVNQHVNSGKIVLTTSGEDRKRGKKESDVPSLEDLIRSRNAKRASAMDALAAKYGGSLDDDENKSMSSPKKLSKGKKK